MGPPEGQLCLSLSAVALGTKQTKGCSLPMAPGNCGEAQGWKEGMPAGRAVGAQGGLPTEQPIVKAGHAGGCVAVGGGGLSLEEEKEQGYPQHIFAPPQKIA